MAGLTHVIRRADLPEDGVVHFELGGERCVAVDVEGDVRAYAVAGPAAQSIAHAAVAEGRLRCPLHGRPIDPDDGRCGASELCRYEPLRVECVGDEIRVTLGRD